MSTSLASHDVLSYKGEVLFPHLQPQENACTCSILYVPYSGGRGLEIPELFVSLLSEHIFKLIIGRSHSAVSSKVQLQTYNCYWLIMINFTSSNFPVDCIIVISGTDVKR